MSDDAYTATHASGERTTGAEIRYRSHRAPVNSSVQLFPRGREFTECHTRGPRVTQGFTFGPRESDLNSRCKHHRLSDGHGECWFLLEHFRADRGVDRAMEASGFGSPKMEVGELDNMDFRAASWTESPRRREPRAGRAVWRQRKASLYSSTRKRNEMAENQDFSKKLI